MLKGNVGRSTRTGSGITITAHFPVHFCAVTCKAKQKSFRIFLLFFSWYCLTWLFQPCKFSPQSSQGRHDKDIMCCWKYDQERKQVIFTLISPFFFFLTRHFSDSSSEKQHSSLTSLLWKKGKKTSSFFCIPGDARVKLLYTLGHSDFHTVWKIVRMWSSWWWRK